MELAGREIIDIESSTFFSHRIVNDNLESAAAEFKNCINSIFPYLKPQYKEIEDYTQDKRQEIIENHEAMSLRKIDRKETFYDRKDTFYDRKDTFYMKQTD